MFSFVCYDSSGSKKERYCMKDEFYTVEQVAQKLDLHPKTVRRFIQEGKLKAGKMGKRWFIKEEALMAMLGESSESYVESSTEELKDVTPLSPGEMANFTQKITVSAVVDVPVTGKDEALRLSNSVLAIMNAKDPSYGPARCNYSFLEKEGKARFILWGSAPFISNMLSCLSQISEGEG